MSIPCTRCGGNGQEPDFRIEGHVMRCLRVSKGLTLRELARRMELSPPYLSDMELGRRQYLPKWQALARKVAK